MRHVGFIALLLLALVIAMPTALGWAMNECQLLASQAAIGKCFQAADREKSVWGLTVAGTLAASIILHWRQSRWRYVALGTLAAGPWLTMFV